MLAERWPYPVAVVVLATLAIPRHRSPSPPPLVPDRACAIQCFAEDTPEVCRERLQAAWELGVPFDVSTAPPGDYPRFGPLLDGRYAYIEEIAFAPEEELLACDVPAPPLTREQAIEQARTNGILGCATLGQRAPLHLCE